MPDTAEPTLAWSERTLWCSWISATKIRLARVRITADVAGCLVAENRHQSGKQNRMASCRSTWPRSREKIRQRRDSRVKNWLKKPGRAEGSAVSCSLAAAAVSVARLHGAAALQAAGCDEAFAMVVEYFLIGHAVLAPRRLPAFGRLRGEPRVDLLGIVHREVMGQLRGRSVKSDPPLVQHQDGIIQLQMRKRVGDGKHDAAVLARQVVEQPDDLPLRARIQAGGDLVAEQDLRIGNQLHRQPEPAFLPAGKNLHPAVRDRAEAGFLQHAVDALVEFRRCRDSARAGGWRPPPIHRR